MTINFKGFINTGAVKYGDDAFNTSKITNRKIWTQLTGQDKVKYGHLADEDGFVRVEMSTNNVPEKKSFLNIKNKKISLDNFSPMDLPIVMSVRNMFKEITAQKADIKYENAYMDSSKAMENISFPEFDNMDFRLQDELKEETHDIERVVPEVKEATKSLTNLLMPVLN